MTRSCILLATIATLAASPILAADLGPVRQPDGTIASPTAKPSNTFGIEASPEFYALTKGDNASGTYADTAVKASLSHSFDNNVVVGGSLQGTFKTNGTQQYYGEATVGYRFKLDRFTLTPSAGIGDTWDNTGLGPAGTSSAVYYVFYLAGDVKLDSKWTWNAFNLRWRNAFDQEWATPKVATGITYSIDSWNSLYANVGYSWKDTGAGLLGDKSNIAFGYKRGF